MPSFKTQDWWHVECLQLLPTTATDLTQIYCQLCDLVPARYYLRYYFAPEGKWEEGMVRLSQVQTDRRTDRQYTKTYSGADKQTESDSERVRAKE